MKNAFPWLAIHKESRYVVAGFVEHSDAERFCALFTHGMYVVRAATDLL